MIFEDDNSMRAKNIQDECKKMMNFHAFFTTKDGKKFDGIIEGIESDCVIVLVGEDVMEEDYNKQENMQRQYGNPGRYRRFRRRPIPFRNIGGVGLIPYPYFVPPYPYPPYPLPPYIY